MSRCFPAWTIHHHHLILAAYLHQNSVVSKPSSSCAKTTSEFSASSSKSSSRSSLIYFFVFASWSCWAHKDSKLKTVILFPNPSTTNIYLDAIMSAYAMASPLLPPIGGNTINTHAHSLDTFSSTQASCGSSSCIDRQSTIKHEVLSSSVQSRDETETVGIAVKEARLDPVALTQALTRTTTPKERRRTRGGNTPRSHSPTQSSVAPTDATPSPTTSPTAATEKHDEAIQFDLSIRFNGQKYSATRTLTSILQLRCDLIRELRRTGTSRDSQRATPTPTDTTLIPEVPSYYGQDCSSGMTRGFTMLQALLSRYCPVLEGWLQRIVLAVGPTSKALEDFLYEPTSHHQIVAVDPLVRWSNSTPSLQSIKEDDDDTLEEEAEKEAEGTAW